MLLCLVTTNPLTYIVDNTTNSHIRTHLALDDYEKLELGDTALSKNGTAFRKIHITVTPYLPRVTHKSQVCVVQRAV